MIYLKALGITALIGSAIIGILCLIIVGVVWITEHSTRQTLVVGLMILFAIGAHVPLYNSILQELYKKRRKY